MKRILIFSHAMELGGAERALLGLLEHLDYDRYQVDLFLMRHEGELLPFLPKQVRLLPENPRYACLAVPFSTVLKKRQPLVALGRFRGKRAAKKRVQSLSLPADNDVALQYSHKFTAFAMPPIGEGTYDLAISFLTPHYFVAEKVQAVKKLAWIHTDYSTVAVDAAEQLAMWERYDQIVSISPAVTDSFLKVFPTLANKMTVIRNMLPLQSMLSQADAFSVEKEMPKDDRLRLLSIGRFCTAKNFDNVPDICRRLCEKGPAVTWYLIGFGGDEALIRQRIAQAGMQERVILLGKRENPYPFLRACDVYVQPSRYEGNCVAVREAQALGKPVVITRYATSASQLEEGVDGVIVPMDNEGCAEGIAALLRDPAERMRLAAACRERDYSNREEAEKIDI